MKTQQAYLQPKETERLFLRPLLQRDEAQWSAFYADERGTQFYPDTFTAGPRPAKRWIDAQFVRYREESFGMMALVSKEMGALVGQCGLLQRHEFTDEPLEIGYALLPAFWGKGYAAEAARFFKNYAFQELKVQEVISLILPENTASVEVAKANGMLATGLVDFYGMPHERYAIMHNG